MCYTLSQIPLIYNFSSGSTKGRDTHPYREQVNCFLYRHGVGAGCMTLFDQLEGTTNWAIGLMSRVFVNGPGDRGSIPVQVIPKTQKMVLDATLLNTQHYKVWIKGKVEQFRERSSTLPFTSV